MGKLEAARKTAKAIAVSSTPDVCKTPMGSSTPPIPYPIVGNFKDSASVSSNVRFGGDPAFTLDKSLITKVTGDEPGTAGGVKSGSNKSLVKPQGASGKVRANGKRVVRHGDLVEMNKGNTKGKVVFQSSGAGGKGGGGNPPVKPETPKEAKAAGEKKGLWGRLSGYVHGVLDVAGFVPGLGAIPDVANAALYAVEGNMGEAGISLVAAVPGIGDTIKGGKMAISGIKGVAKSTAKNGLQEGTEKVLKHEAGNAVVDSGKVGRAASGPDNTHISETLRQKKVETLKKNKANGKKREEEVKKELQAEGHDVVGSQVSVKTPETRRVVDHLIADGETGEIRAIEVKSGDATRTSSQIAKDTAMEQKGGTIIGKNAPPSLVGKTIKIKTEVRK